MNLNTLFLILLSVGLSALAQITMKHGVSSNVIQQNLNSPPAAILSFATNGSVIAGIFLDGVGAIVWLFVLARMEVSMAYPFVALGFLLTTGLAALLLGEEVGLTRIAGTVLVMLGVILVARS